MVKRSPIHLAMITTKTMGMIYIMFPVVSTSITLKEIVIRDCPANIPHAPKNANVPGKNSPSKTLASFPINLPYPDPKMIPGTNNPLGT